MSPDERSPARSEATDEPGRSLVLRRAGPLQRLQSRREAARTLCPHCHRVTVTVDRGACAECWQAKTEDGHPVLRPKRPRTEPLLDIWGSVPDWVWLLAGAAAVGAVLRGIVHVLSL